MTSKQDEEEKLNEAFKNAEVVDCTSKSNGILEKTVGCYSLEQQLEKQIEHNAELYKEVVKLRRWKEQVLSVIDEKVEG